MYRDWRWEEGDFAFSPRGDAALAEGLEVVRQDLLARLVSPRGSHWAFPAEGSRLPEFLQATDDPLTRVEAQQEAELTCLEDARVQEATSTWESGGLRLALTLAEGVLEFLLPDPLRRP
ncbi:hypothetical protein [Thermus sp.]|uniref:hypothetical protein n=1 Tax=Thermus sp. TaxID=275 RepID=UPI0025E5A46D|nr:hypothetical protein [Thermus sp.]MCS6868964.1 hypothetical protein [Thermus sp.]